MTRISRRAFLKLAGVSVAAAALYESSGSILNALSLIDQTTPSSAEEEWVPSVCQLCPAECGIMVRVVGVMAVKIEGNPQNPNNQVIYMLSFSPK